jgi:hypothetical protein
MLLYDFERIGLGSYVGIVAAFPDEIYIRRSSRASLTVPIPSHPTCITSVIEAILRFVLLVLVACM